VPQTAPGLRIDRAEPFDQRELRYFEEEYSWAVKMKTLLLKACEEPLVNSFEQWQQAYSKILADGYLEINFEPQKSRKQRGRAAKSKNDPILS
jgi:hypothetical protein